MKKIVAIAFFATALSFTYAAQAQVGKTVKKTAESVGNETGEAASKGFSKIKDKTYKGKQGPQGQTIYIDKYSHYYYVNEKGRKIYLTKAELKNKPVKQS